MFLLNLELSTRNNGKTWQPVYSVSVRIRYTKRIPLKETLPPLIAFGWNRCLRLESLSLVGIAVFGWNRCLWLESLSLVGIAVFGWNRCDTIPFSQSENYTAQSSCYAKELCLDRCLSHSRRSLQISEAQVYFGDVANSPGLGF